MDGRIGRSRNADEPVRGPAQHEDPDLADPIHIVHRPERVPVLKAVQDAVVVEIAVVLDLEIFDILGDRIVDAVIGHVEDAGQTEVAADPDRQARLAPPDVQPIDFGVREYDGAPGIVGGLGACPQQVHREGDVGREAGRQRERLVRAPRRMGDVRDRPDFSEPAGAGRVGEDEQGLVDVERVRIRILFEAVVFDGQAGRRALVALNLKAERPVDIAQQRETVGLDLLALVLIVDALDRVHPESFGHAGADHPGVPHNQEHRRTDVVLDLGVLLLVDGNLVALAVDRQGGHDDKKHDRGADEELDKGEPAGAVRPVNRGDECLHSVTW
jgi:hypothetical protein